MSEKQTRFCVFREKENLIKLSLYLKYRKRRKIKPKKTKSYDLLHFIVINYYQQIKNKKTQKNQKKKLKKHAAVCDFVLL